MSALEDMKILTERLRLARSLSKVTEWEVGNHDFQVLWLERTLEIN